MYYQLIDWDQTNVEESDLPQAQDLTFCNHLVDGEVQPTTSRDLTFRLGEACLALDYLPLRGVRRAMLCSQRFLDVLTSASVPYTGYPVHLLHRETLRPLDTRYYFWLPQSIHNAIDWERSEAWTNPETGMRRLTRIVLASEVEEASPLLFHARGTGRYFVHETLCRHLRAARITGIAFASLNAAFSPYADIKKQELEVWLKDHPDDWAAWCRLSDSLAAARRYEEALAPLEQALRIKPDGEKAWYKRGCLLRRLENPSEALIALKHAIELQPQSLAWGEYCAILRTLGAKEEALAYAQAWVQQWGKSPLPWYELGVTLAALAREEEALQAIDQGLALGGGARQDDLYLAKEEVLSRLGKYEEALSICNLRIQVTPLKRTLWERKIRALSALGRQDQAKKARQELQALEQQREENLKKRPI